MSPSSSLKRLQSLAVPSQPSRSLFEDNRLKLHDRQPESDFADLHAAFHLAHKFQCPDVEARLLSILSKFYTPRFGDYARYDVSRPTMPCPPREVALAAVNIACLADTPSMLPFALYQVCTLKGLIVDGCTGRNGSVEYLSPSNLRLCLDARAKLGDEMASFVKVFTDEPSYDCRWAPLHRSTRPDHGGCGDGCARFVVFRAELVRARHQCIKDWAEQYELCALCTREMLAREKA